MNSFGEAEAEVYSVSSLNRAVRTTLEGEFFTVWVEGEISNFTRPRSGHLYFTLKDAQTQVRCAMFRQQQSAINFTPADGQQVQLRARVTLYEARGDYQLVVERMQASGSGTLQRNFEALKQRLLAEGLFADSHKQPLPTLPQQIGVVTSSSGAAVRDIITVLRRRMPLIDILIYPVEVQGAGAAATLVNAIALANRQALCDLLIVGRGGGSLEDLWPFNEERVARAIFASKIPVVSAVGHETDFTIADLVADLRAPTPSAAAELISPDRRLFAQQLSALMQRAIRAVQRQQQQWQERLLACQRLLRDPQAVIQQQSQRLDYLELRFRTLMQQRLRLQQSHLQQLGLRLQTQNPARQLQQQRQQQYYLQQRLLGSMQQIIARRRQQLQGGIQALEIVSPLATLQRGYAIARQQNGRVIEDAAAISCGETITVMLASGSLEASVSEVNPQHP
ncbi:MAG: exodeoxyribonuclease VII large subunit [Gammaproteobacteria bacterium]|nr:exodeoxyribonuclease VII large subunit [Gammaproteobacteria bacterium]